MISGYEELDYQQTPLGELILRRRRSPSHPEEPVYEVKIDDQMLMSSVVNASERELARLALAGRIDRPCDVLVGGLGLGYTAAAALEYPNVRSLVVVEFLAPVIDWHRRRLVPMAGRLLDDARCALRQGDFFEEVGPAHTAPPGPRYDAILLDIDHSPESWLRAPHRSFYTEPGLRALLARLQPDGVFGLWSAAPPTEPFLDLVRGAFPTVRSHEVCFYNPHLSVMDSNWVILAEVGPARG